MSTTLAQLSALKRRAGARARGGWRALAIFGLLTLGSMVLYRNWFDASPLSSPDGLRFHYSFFAGLPADERSAALSIAYWALMGPLTYLACAWSYRSHAARHGVSLRWRPWAGAGAGLFALMLASLLTPRLLGPSILPAYEAGLLTPLLPIGLGLLALAAVERSVTIGASAALYTFLVVSMGHYRLGTLPLPLVGETSWDQMYVVGPNLILLSAVLFAGAALDAGVSARARRRAGS